MRAGSNKPNYKFIKTVDWAGGKIKNKTVRKDVLKKFTIAQRVFDDCKPIKATVSAVKAGKIKVSLPGGTNIALNDQGKKISQGQAVTLGIRPEHITIGEKNDGELKGNLRIAEYLGSETMFYASLADGSDLSVKADGLTSAKQGADIKFGLPAKACHLFDAKGITILNGDLSK